MEGVNVATKHKKPRQPGLRQGGIVKKEAPIYACKVHARLPQVQQAAPALPTRCWQTAKRCRVCKKCGADI